MADTALVRRAPLAWDWTERHTLIAEHGYSLLVTIEREGSKMSLLYDAGLGRETVTHNLDVLGVRVDGLRPIVLSHGPPDHHGGLEGMVRRIA